MDDLIGRLVAKIGDDRTAAYTAAGITTRFLLGERRAETACAPAGRLPTVNLGVGGGRSVSSSAGVSDALGGAATAGNRMMMAEG